MTNFIIRKAERVAPLFCRGKWSKNLLLGPAVEGLQGPAVLTCTPRLFRGGMQLDSQRHPLFRLHGETQVSGHCPPSPSPRAEIAACSGLLRAPSISFSTSDSGQRTRKLAKRQAATCWSSCSPLLFEPENPGDAGTSPSLSSLNDGECLGGKGTFPRPLPHSTNVC